VSEEEYLTDASEQ